MKKFYSRILIFLLAFMLPSIVDAAKITFNFDDPSRIDLLINGEPYEGTLIAGDNEIECFNMTITAKEGFILDKVLQTDSYDTDYPLPISNNSCYSGFASDKYIKVITKVAAEANTGSVVLNVDKASAVIVSVTETGREIKLEDGLNTVTYDPTTEKQLKVYSSATAQFPLYSVTAPNSSSSISKVGSVYFVALPCQGTVDIVSQYPPQDCYITFTFSEGSEGFIKKLTKDTTTGETLQMTDNKLKVNAGTLVYLHGNEDDYELNSFKVDGEYVTFDNPYRIIVLQKDVTVSIDATKYQEATVTINVNDASMLKANYGSTMYPGEEIILKNGDNEVVINANNNTMIFASADPSIYYISSATVDGVPLDYTYDGKAQTDYLYGGEKINIVMERRVRDLDAVVLLDDAKPFDWTVVSIINQKFDLVAGYNHIKFCQDDSPLMIKGGAGKLFVYIDDEAVVPSDGGFVCNLKNGAVIKIYAAKSDEPNFYALTFAEDGFDKVDIKVDEINAVTQRAGYEYLEGTKIEITPRGGDIKGVALDGVSLAANAENTYSFNVSGAHNISFLTDDAGVERVIDDMSGINVIYNLQGLKVKADALNNLPAGIYVVNGKKVLVK